MKISIIEEGGLLPALYGLGLSHGKTSGITFEEFRLDINVVEDMKRVSLKLYNKDGGHNKFLESIGMWTSVTAPIFWWVEADTYRIASKQSESTMHTLLKNPLVDPISQDTFIKPIPIAYLNFLESIRLGGDLEELKAYLPGGFIQTREWYFCYKELRNIISQRKTHRLTEWKEFCKFMLENARYQEYLQDLK